MNKYSTPAIFAQFKFDSVTRVFTEPGRKGRGKSRCFRCMDWVKCLALLFVRDLSPTQSAAGGICPGCLRTLTILPIYLQKDFWQKVEKNLKKALEVGLDA